MYVWRSEALKNYGLGWLIATASTPDEARSIIKDNAEKYILKQRSWYESEDVDHFIALIEIDLRLEPENYSVIYIAGSE